MKRRTTRLGWAVLLLAVAGCAARPSNPPHILVVMVDDLGWRDSSPAAWPDPGGPGARHFRTPHLDRLASEGMRFREAYASAPVCTPTRTSFMTGATPARNHITYWTRFPGRDQSAAFPGLGAPPWNVDGLQPGDTTLPGLLREAGYRTIHAGKAHFGTGDGPGTGGDPTALGFDVNIAGWAAGGPGSFYGLDDFSAAERQRRGGRESDNRSWDVPGLDAYHGQDVFLTDVLASEADAALREAVASGQPVFLHFAPYAVHAPLMVNERLRDAYPELSGPELAYATMVTSVDDALGRLLATLDELGIAEDTIVVYTGDNGGLSAHGRGGQRHTHNAPLRSGKGSAYEGGVRVPLVVRRPGVVTAGAVKDGAIVTHDLFPTLLGWAGVPIPAKHAEGVDGIDLRAAIEAGEAIPERPILWHQPHYWGVAGPGIEPFSAMRMGPLKLVYFHAGPRFELYDVVEDIGEQHDLAAGSPERVRALASVLTGALEAAGAQMSIDLQTGEPVALPLEALPR